MSRTILLFLFLSLPISRSLSLSLAFAFEASAVLEADGETPARAFFSPAQTRKGMQSSGRPQRKANSRRSKRAFQVVFSSSSTDSSGISRAAAQSRPSRHRLPSGTLAERSAAEM